MISDTRALALCSFEGPRERSLPVSGGHGEGETPLPIPNRAVKPLSADGTWPARAWESRTPPVFLQRVAWGGPLACPRTNPCVTGAAARSEVSRGAWSRRHGRAAEPARRRGEPSTPALRQRDALPAGAPDAHPGPSFPPG